MVTGRENGFPHGGTPIAPASRGFAAQIADVSGVASEEFHAEPRRGRVADAIIIPDERRCIRIDVRRG